MIHLIADKIVESLAALPFVEKITGIVKPLKYYGPDKKIIVIPVAFNTDPTTCNTSQLNDYVPNSKRRSIIYFEDQGTSMIRNGTYLEFTSQMRLVCWFNHKKIGAQYDSSLIALNVLKYLPDKLGNFSNLLGVWVDVLRQEPNDGGAFSRYSYQEEINQYITYPYDYVSFILQATYKVRKDCIEDIAPENIACGLPLTWDTENVTFDSEITFDTENYG